jgi:hypothetical protein
MKPEPGRFNAATLELQALVTTPNPDAAQCQFTRISLLTRFVAGVSGGTGVHGCSPAVGAGTGMGGGGGVARRGRSRSAAVGGRLFKSILISAAMLWMNGQSRDLALFAISMPVDIAKSVTMRLNPASLPRAYSAENIVSSSSGVLPPHMYRSLTIFASFNRIVSGFGLTGLLPVTATGIAGAPDVLPTADAGASGMPRSRRMLTLIRRM